MRANAGSGRLLDSPRAAAGGIEGHVADPASIATSRRRRTAKTDMIDGKTLLRALLAYQIPWGTDTDQFRGQTEVVIRSLWR